MGSIRNSARHPSRCCGHALLALDSESNALLDLDSNVISPVCFLHTLCAYS